MQTEERVSVQYLETGSVALDILSRLPQSELPDIIVVPFRLPVLTGFDFIAMIRRYERLRNVPVFVWGAEIQPGDIEQMYQAGTACLPGYFGPTHLDVLRQVCRKRNATAARMSKERSLNATKASAQRNRGSADRDLRLGMLFAWTGCISAVLWVYALLQLGTPRLEDNLAPLTIYAALESAGLLLMLRPAGQYRGRKTPKSL